MEEQVKSSLVSKHSFRNVSNNCCPFFPSYTCERCIEQKIGIERLIGKETQNIACFRGAGSRVLESDPPGDGLLSILFAQDVHFMTPEAVSRLGAKWYAATNKGGLGSILRGIVKTKKFDGYGEMYDRMRPKAEKDILRASRAQAHMPPVNTAKTLAPS